MPHAILDSLWNNWMFRLSLSSNELFHSNFLQALLSHPSADASDDRSGVTSWASVETLAAWAGLDHAWVQARKAQYGHCQVFVHREWKQLDLAIVVRAPHGATYREVVLFAVELKIKSYPTSEQIQRYLAAMRINNRNTDIEPKIVLLSLVQPSPSVAAIPDCSVMDFRRLAQGIGRLDQSRLKLGPAIDEYARLCISLHALSEYWSGQIHPGMQLCEVTGMKPLYRRLDPIWSKLCAAYLCQLVRDHMERVGVPDGVELHAIPGFSNSTWSADFLFCARAQDQHEQGAGGAPRVLAKVGVQVEGRTIRFMLNALNVGDGHRHARSIVEEALIAQATTHGLYRRLKQLLELRDGHCAGSLEQVRQFWQPFRGLALGKDGIPLLSTPVPEKGCAFKLTGYKNGPTFGHADYRLRLSADATLSDIGALIAAALEGQFNEGGRDAFLGVLTDPQAFAAPGN